MEKSLWLADSEAEGAEGDEEAFEEIEEDVSDGAIEVVIPEGLKEGDLFIAMVGDEEFEILVPPGYNAGDTLQVALEDMPDETGEDAQPSGSKPKLKPKRQVSFTEEEPSVMLFSPELGGLALGAAAEGGEGAQGLGEGEEPEEPEEPEELGEVKEEGLEDVEGVEGVEGVVEVVIPENVVPGDVLEVESNGEMIEVVVPEGAEVGMTLSVQTLLSPSPRDRELEEMGIEYQPTEKSARPELDLEVLEAEEPTVDPTEPLGEREVKRRSPKNSPSSSPKSQRPADEAAEARAVEEALVAEEVAEDIAEAEEASVQVEPEQDLSPSAGVEDVDREAGDFAEERDAVREDSEMHSYVLHDSDEDFEVEPHEAQAPHESQTPPEPPHVVETLQMSQMVQTEASDVHLRRWTETAKQVFVGEVAVQTEPPSEELNLVPEVLKGLRRGTPPPLPQQPSCEVQCRIPLFEDMSSGLTLTALKLAVETLQKEKEELQQKLRDAQKEIFRLELRDEDELKALRAEQHTALRRENDELRKIALAALRQSEEPEVSKKSSNKICRIEAEAVKEKKWLTRRERAKKAEVDQVSLEDLETETEKLPPKPEAPEAPEAPEGPEVRRLPSGHAGGSHGLRRVRSQSDSCVTFETWQARTSEPSATSASASPSSVAASPCGSAKEKVVRVKPRGPANRFAPDPHASRTSAAAAAAATWRPSSAATARTARTARLATSSVYAAAALSADAKGWGATATAAEAMARPRLQTYMVQPLSDEVKVAPVCERAVNGAFVLEPGQQEPDLHCVDEIPESAAHEAAENMELKEFYLGGAFASGCLLSDCCPTYTLVDDGGADVPLYRHISGCLLLAVPVYLAETQDAKLYFCRGPLPVMRRYGQGVLGCMELLYELFADTDGQGGSEFYVMEEGPGYENAGETGGTESLCYLPVLVDKKYSSTSSQEKERKCFIRLPDMASSAGCAFASTERRLRAEMYHSDGRRVKQLATFLSRLGRAEEAALHWQKALEDDEANHGTSHLETAMSAAALASCYDDLGRAEDAEVFHGKALATMAKNFGRSSSEAVACELSLAACRHVQGKCKLHRMLPSTQSGLLCLEGATAQAVSVIFGQAVGDQREEHAETLYRQALGILRRSLGPGHPDTLHCLNNLALCLADQGKLKEAEQLLRRTVAGMEVVHAPTHPRPIQALSNLACCLAEQGQNEEAESHHRRAFENCKRRLGWQHPETSACAQSLAQFLTSCGRCTEAALLELQADQLGRPCWQRGKS